MIIISLGTRLFIIRDKEGWGEGMRNTADDKFGASKWPNS